MNKKIFWGIIATIIIALLSFGFYFLFKDKKEEPISDAKRFATDYTLVPEENLFVYRNAKQIIKILEKGSGVVYLGFDECPWCQTYALYLNEAAMEAGIEKIYYLDILEDRTNHTDEYQKILDIIGDHLQNDEEGNKRVFVPDVSIVIDGAMIEHDYETSKDTKGYEDPADYWTNDKVKKLKDKLTTAFKQVVDAKCSECDVN